MYGIGGTSQWIKECRCFVDPIAAKTSGLTDVKATASARKGVEADRVSEDVTLYVYIYVCVLLSVVLWTSSVVSSSKGLLVRQHAPMDIKAMRQSCF